MAGWFILCLVVVGFFSALFSLLAMSADNHDEEEELAEAHRRAFVESGVSSAWDCPICRSQGKRA